MNFYGVYFISLKKNKNPILKLCLLSLAGLMLKAFRTTEDPAKKKGKKSTQVVVHLRLCKKSFFYLQWSRTKSIECSVAVGKQINPQRRAQSARRPVGRASRFSRNSQSVSLYVVALECLNRKNPRNKNCPGCCSQ